MFDELSTSASWDLPVTAEQMAVRLSAALLFGLCVMGVYLLSHGRGSCAKMPLATTLVMLSVLISMVTLVIGNSVARAFGLVGALSIVRFRTVVDDTRDTAFVIFSVIVGMAAGAGLFLVTMIGVPIAGTTAVVLNYWSVRRAAAVPKHYKLFLRVEQGCDMAALMTIVAQDAQSYELIETAMARRHNAIEFAYRLAPRTPTGAVTLVANLMQVPGILRADVTRK